jgi:glyoxylase I family protein
MRVKLTSIMVDDQAKAEAFYTNVLGFIKKHDFPIGAHRWLTVVSPEGPDNIEVTLESNSNPAARIYQAAMLAQGIPLAAFEVSDIAADYERLKNLGVEFVRVPTNAGPVIMAIFADTCGNLIQLYQVVSPV